MYCALSTRRCIPPEVSVRLGTDPTFEINAVLLGTWVYSHAPWITVIELHSCLTSKRSRGHNVWFSYLRVSQGEGGSLFPCSLPFFPYVPMFRSFSLFVPYNILVYHIPTTKIKTRQKKQRSKHEQLCFMYVETNLKQLLKPTCQSSYFFNFLRLN